MNLAINQNPIKKNALNLRQGNKKCKNAMQNCFDVEQCLKRFDNWLTNQSLYFKVNALFTESAKREIYTAQKLHGQITTPSELNFSDDLNLE